MLKPKEWEEIFERFKALAASNANLCFPEESEAPKNRLKKPLSARNLGVKSLILKDQPNKVDLAMDTINQAIQLLPNMARSYRIRGEIL